MEVPGIVRPCDAVERRSGSSEASHREREVWDEADTLLLAIIEDSLMRSADKIVLVLHGRDREMAQRGR